MSSIEICNLVLLYSKGDFAKNLLMNSINTFLNEFKPKQSIHAE